MESIESKRQIITRLLTERKAIIARPARQLLAGMLEDDSLLSRMHFCQPEERPWLRNSVLVVTEGSACWAVILGNDPAGGRSDAVARARLVLQGLQMTPGQILARLREVPVWFLATDAPFVAVAPGEALRVEWTVWQMSRLPAPELRRRLILDQIDAALEAGDREACRRLVRDLQAAS